MRLAYSTACYLNPDEAQHFASARAQTWIGVYRESLTHTHPPLFILLLHGFTLIGRSEVILRLPSVLAGSAAIWIIFVWLRRIVGPLASLGGLLFMAASPAAISASTEVRQYGVQLLFLSAAIYATERGLSDRSARWALAQTAFLLGALLTHYITPLVFLPLDLYVLLRCLQERSPGRILSVFIGGQLFLAGALAFLYFHHIRHSSVFSANGLQYLAQYYYVPGSETLLAFSKRAFLLTFQYLVSPQQAIPSIVLTLAGLAALAVKVRHGSSLVVLVVSVWVIGFGMSLLRVFPFIGTHHQAYLLPFAALAFAAVLVWLPRSALPAILLLAVVAAPLWVLRHPPDNDPNRMPMRDMDAAVKYIHQTVPPGAPLVLDDESHYEFAYYLARNDVDVDRGETDRISGHGVYGPLTYTWAFQPDSVLAQVRQAAVRQNRHSNDACWLASVAWLQAPLATQLPQTQLQTVKQFGNISVVSLDCQ